MDPVHVLQVLLLDNLKCLAECLDVHLRDGAGSGFTVYSVYWVLAKGLNLSCYNKEAISFTMDPRYGN